MRTSFRIQRTACLLWLAIFASFSDLALYAETAGPSITHEMIFPAVTKAESGEDAIGDTQKTKFRSSRRVTQMDAAIPLIDVTKGLVAVLGSRTIEDTTRDIESTHTTTSINQSSGIAVAWRPTLGITPFILVSRYTDHVSPTTENAMTESIAGVDFSASLPNFLTDPGDKTSSRILVRERRYPHASRYLLLAEHTIERANGLVLSAGIPSHATIGWRIPDQLWFLQGGVAVASRQFLARQGETETWTEGYRAEVFTKARRHIASVAHLSLKIGAVMIHDETFITGSSENSGDAVASEDTPVAPTATLGLETVF